MEAIRRAPNGWARVSLSVVLALVWIFSRTAAPVTQAPRIADGAESFEVASVRPNDSGGAPFAGVQTQPGGSVVATNVALHTIIEFAYGLDVLYERVEGPDLLQKRFDIMARAAGDVPRVPLRQVGPLNVMMQNLLAERFKLKVRMEERPHEGYALVRARPDDRLGPGLRPSTLQCPRAGSGSSMKEAASAPETGARADCTFTVINNEMRANGHQMSALAQSLSLALKSPVIDRTGLTGWYEVRMTYDQASLMELWGLKPVVDEAGPKPPSLFVALEEQLGLKLERERVTARTLIVEHVEAPSEN